MQDLHLDIDEGIILEENEVERYGKSEDSIDEMILTDKHIIMIYDHKKSLFSKAERVVEKISLQDIKIVGGNVQISKVEHDDYGTVLRILYVDGHREFFSFYNERRSIPKWIDALQSTVMRAQNIEESTSEVYSSTIMRSKKKVCFCINCGEKLVEASNFCSACGTPVYMSATENSLRKDKEEKENIEESIQDEQKSSSYYADVQYRQNSTNFFHSVASEVAKYALDFVANDLLDGDSEEINKMRDQLNDRVGKTREESIHSTATGRYVLTIDEFEHKTRGKGTTAVKDIEGKELFHIDLDKGREEYRFFDEGDYEVAVIKEQTGTSAEVYCYKKHKGSINLHISIKGYYVSTSWNDWRVQLNMLKGKIKYLCNGIEIATFQISLLGREKYIIYLSNMQDLSDVLIIGFAVEAMSKYAEKHSSTSSSRSRRSSSKSGSKDKFDSISKDTSSNKKRSFNWGTDEPDRGSWDFDDDDD